MDTSKLTAKRKATTPRKTGDRMASQVKEKNAAETKKLEPLDLEYHKFIESTLSEWSSQMDDEAYRDL